MPSRLTVRAATFLTLCAAAAASLACGTVYLALSPSFTSIGPLDLDLPQAALLAGTAALPITATALAAAGVHLRLCAGPKFLRRVLGARGRYLTHAAVARTALAAALLTGGLVGVCAALPHHAALVILGTGGVVCALAVGVGIAAWRGRRVDLADKFEAAASYGEPLVY
jgi:hypothetical protein